MNWKLVAIILFILLILETVGIVFIANLGFKALEKEAKCSINICQDGGYDSFTFDDTTNICYCYLNNEIAKQQYID